MESNTSSSQLAGANRAESPQVASTWPLRCPRSNFNVRLERVSTGRNRRSPTTLRSAKNISKKEHPHRDLSTALRSGRDDKGGAALRGIVVAEQNPLGHLRTQPNWHPDRSVPGFPTSHCRRRRTVRLSVKRAACRSLKPRVSRC